VPRSLALPLSSLFVPSTDKEHAMIVEELTDWWEVTLE
jgi:hypothetical protein